MADDEKSVTLLVRFTSTERVAEGVPLCRVGVFADEKTQPMGTMIVAGELDDARREAICVAFLQLAALCFRSPPPTGFRHGAVDQATGKIEEEN
jgi:hypothetical protein